MTAFFEMPISTETLEPDEIATITGCKARRDQIDWLSKNGWTSHANKAGNPIVGRLYARLKLSGINPATLGSATGWVPDLSEIR